MPSSTPSRSSTKRFSLDAAIQESEQHLLTQFSSLTPRLQTLLATRFEPDVESISVPEPEPVYQPVATHLSQDELLSILQKLHEVVLLPSLQLETETALYLEQQLSDVLGFEISSTLEDKRLTFSKGILESLPHLPSNPLHRHTPPKRIREASKQLHRSFFGWQHLNPLESSSEDSDAYWVALPHTQVIADSPVPLQWLYKKKVVIINTANAVCAVATVLDSYLSTSNKFQMGASPAVTREGMFWSPQNLGKFLCFFVPDPDSRVQCGIYQMIKATP